MTAGALSSYSGLFGATLVLGLLVGSVGATAAAEPRGASSRSEVRAPAAATRPSRSTATDRPRDEEGSRPAVDGEPDSRAGAPAPRRVKSDFGKLPIQRNDTAATRPTTQKAATRAPSTGFNPTRLVTALGVVLVLILLLRWVGRRFFGMADRGRSTRAVQVLSRSPISPRQQLVLLRVGRRLLVVADGGGQMNTLSEITDADEVAALLGQLQDDHAGRMTTTFGSLFGKMRAPFEPEAAAGNAASDQEPDDDAAVLRRPALRVPAEEDDPAVESTRQELSGLMDKVRTLSRQFKSP